TTPPVGVPFSLDDWPNPRGPTRAPWTWTDSFKLPLQTIVPANQRDWPVPRGYARSIDLLTGLDSGLALVVPPTPFAQSDWPVPKGKQPTAPSWTDSFKLPLQSIFPENQYDWPVPAGYRRNEQLGFVQGSTLILVPQFPQQ